MCRGLRPCLLAVALTGSHFPSTEPAQQAQSHCCASAQQSHLSFRSNLTAAHSAISLRPAWGEIKIYRTRGRMPAEFLSPEGRQPIGRWSSVHAVRARPLPAIKNNIEPDEHREEADTIPRGVLTPRYPSLRAHALRYPHLSAYAASLRSVAPGSGLFFSMCRGFSVTA